MGQTVLMRSSVAVVHDLVGKIEPLDQLESEHISDTLLWLESTDDVFRRQKPATPPRHLVSYVAIFDPEHMEVLLVDHVNAGLFLPPGGHVEPDEHPLATARRECHEELGIEASIVTGDGPSFLTVTTTVGRDAGHTDVSLWFINEVSRSSPLSLDETEFRDARWWSIDEVMKTATNQFDPHFHRFVQKAFSSRE
jgi:8-oxo-dGTP pyrophosphatase MutT (NUDIX family)